MSARPRAIVAAVTLLAVVAAPGAALAAESGMPRESAAVPRTKLAASGSADDVLSAVRSGFEHRRVGPAGAVAGFAAAPADAPVITSPTEGQAVSGTVNLSATSAATEVEFVVRDATETVLQTTRAAVAGGTATASFASHFLADGAYRVTAAGCEADGCGPTATVAFSATNAAPTVTSPEAGAEVAGSFVASADAAHGPVTFFVDGVAVATDATAPYAVTLSAAGMMDGPHQLTARTCAEEGSLRCGPESAPVRFTVVVAELHPTARLSRSTISPNGDGKYDSVTVTYDLPEPQTATFSVLNSAGTVVVAARKLKWTPVQGTFSYVWNGRYSSGAWASHGTHRIRIDTAATIGGTPVTGRAERAVTVDRSAPALSSITRSTTTLYPVTDGYKDVLTVAVSISTASSSSRMIVRNSAGSVVRTVSVGARAAGRQKFAWNGRRTDGRLVPAGSYSIQLQATDAVANTRTSGKYAVAVSSKRLYVRTGTKTVTAYGSTVDAAKGACSELLRNSHGWTDSVGYRSNAYCGSTDNDDDLALTLNTATLPTAIKYGTVRVSAYGLGYAPTSDTAAIVMLNKSLGVTGYDCALSTPLRWHACVSTPISVTGRTVHWVTGTALGNWYDIKSFKLTWTYYVLA